MIRMFGRKKSEPLDAATKVLEVWMKSGYEKIAELTALSKTAQENLIDLQSQVEGLKTQVAEIGTIPLRVPIDPSVAILKNAEFMQALEAGFHEAALEFAPYQKRDFTQTFPSIKGEVSKGNEFQAVVDDKELIVLAGLKTKYSGRDQALIQVIMRDIRSKPFVVDADTKVIIFPRYRSIPPESYFGLQMIEGGGKLRFSLIGISITPWRGLF